MFEHILNWIGLISVYNANECCSRNSQVPNFHKEKFVPLNLAMWLTSLSVEFDISFSNRQVRYVLGP